MVAPRITTLVRDTLIPNNGTIIYNLDINDFEVYDDNIWKVLGATGGGAVTGAANGTSLLSGTIVELGGSDLYKATDIGGNNQTLSIGKKPNPLASFNSFSNLNTNLVSEAGGLGNATLQLTPGHSLVRSSLSGGVKSIELDADGTTPGIYITDSAEEIGLYGAMVFEVYGDQQYTQQAHLNAAVELLFTYERASTIGAGSTTTLDGSQNIIFISGGALATTITLPIAPVANYNKVYTIKNLSTGVVTIESPGALIDGNTTVTLNTQYEFVKVLLESSNNYFIIG